MEKQLKVLRRPERFTNPAIMCGKRGKVYLKCQLFLDFPKNVGLHV